MTPLGLQVHATPRADLKRGRVGHGRRRRCVGRPRGGYAEGPAAPSIAHAQTPFTVTLSQRDEVVTLGVDAIRGAFSDSLASAIRTARWASTYRSRFPVGRRSSQL